MARITESKVPIMYWVYIIIIVASSFHIGWTVRAWWEARLSKQYADAVLDFFLTDYNSTCMCDECYDPTNRST